MNDYYIGETEVTQELWKAVMGNNPAKFKGENYPIENVSFNDCVRFVEKLSQLTGRRFRLPTEAEWEYAARGGKYHSDYKYSGSDNANDVAWCFSNSFAKTHPVKKKKPNALGIYDMSGSVWEWCDTMYEPYQGAWGNWFNRLIRNRFKVVRGGGFRGFARYARVTNRYAVAAWRNDYTVGLRLAMQLK